MPAKNSAFHLALQDNQLAIRPQIILALNTLIQATDENTFRGAIITHHTTWDNLGAAGASFRVAAGEGNNDGFLKSDGEGNANHSFSLKQLALEKRVLFTLKDATVQQLEDMLNPGHSETEIRKKLFGENGQSTFGEPQLTIPPAPAPWNPNTEDLLSNAAIARIKTEVRKQLLSKKIATHPDAAQLTALIRSGNDGEFQANARTIFGVQPAPAGGVHFTDNMLLDDLPGSITHAAAKRNISLYIPQIANPTGDVVRACLLDINQFKARLPNPANLLADADIPDLQGQLGTRYLIATYSSLGRDRLKNLEDIASSISEVTLKNLIGVNVAGAGLPEKGPYVEKAVTNATLPIIRQAAASQALKLKIAQCDDETALDELISVASNDGLKHILATETALGYTAKNDFREAFTVGNIDDIIVHAHVRKSLLIAPSETAAKAAYLENLKELITDANVANTYVNRFAKGQSDVIKRKLIEYFSNPQQVQLARTQALATWAQQQFADMGRDELEALIADGADVDTIKDLLKPLLGLDPDDTTLDHLVVNQDSGLGLLIRCQAQVAILIEKTKKPSDLSLSTQTSRDNYVGLLKLINNPELPLLRHQILPAKEKQKVKISSIECLIRNFPKDRIPVPAPNTDNILKNVAKATNIEEFKRALTTLGLTGDHPWVNAKTMAQMQQVACLRLLQLDIDNSLSFGNDVHPKLINLIENLSITQQRALLEKPQAFVALSQAVDGKEIKRILSDAVVDERLIGALVAENTRLDRLANLCNSEIAKILAKISPPLDLKTEQIQQIRDIILDQDPIYAAAGAPKSYASTIQSIVAITERDAEVYHALGMDNGGLNITNDAIRQAISQQHTFNQPLLQAYDRVKTLPAEKTKVIYQLIASLNKNAELTAAEVRALHNALELPTYDEFFTQFNRQAAALAKFAPPINKQITPQIFSRMKVMGRKLSLKDADTYTLELGEQDAVISQITNAYNGLKLKSDAPLKRLASTTSLYWLYPEFQSLSKENAKKKGGELRELSEECDTRVVHLQTQLKKVQEQLDSIPAEQEVTDQAILKEIRKRREELINLQDKMQTDLDEYQKLQVLFYGDCNIKGPAVLRDGILAALKQIEEGKTGIKISGYTSYAQDYPLTLKPAYLAAGWQSKSKPKVADAGMLKIKSGASSNSFDPEAMVKDGFFREYTIAYPSQDSAGNPIEVKSSYIEERGRSVAQRDNQGNEYYTQEVTLTAKEFPPGDQPQARVHHIMEMVTRMIAERGKPPTIKDPIILDGPPDQIAYAWTAFMAIAINDPNMRFNPEAIIIDNPTLTSAQLEKEWLTKDWRGNFSFKEKSLFTKHFKNNSSFTGLSKTLQEIDELKFGKEQQKSMQTMTRDMATLTRTYRSKQAELRDAKQDSSDDTLGPNTAPRAPG